VLKIRFGGGNREVHRQWLVLLPSSTNAISSPHAPESVALTKYPKLNFARGITTPAAACAVHDAVPAKSFRDDVLVAELVLDSVAVDTLVQSDA
jgi:hypothetical protein